MSERRLLDYSPELGMAQFATYSEGKTKNDVQVVIETRGLNIQAVLDENARMRGVNDSINSGTQTWGHHVGRIPFWLYEQFCRENPELRQGTKEANAWLVAKLNSREYSHLKTFDGRA